MSKNFELLNQLGESLSTFPPELKTEEPESVMVEPKPAATAPTLTPPPVKPPRGVVSAEEMKLIQRLFLAPGLEAPKMVVFCGVEEGADSASLCARAGEILAARMEGEICIIDGDLRSPSLHEHFGLENHTGLLDLVYSSEDPKSYAQQVGGGPLWVLPAGSRTAEQPAVLSLDRLRDRLLELRAQFSYLLISAPPANQFPDAVLFGQLADGVVLVLKANSTRRATALKVKESLEASSVHLLGAVLTDRVFPIPEALYRKF